MKNQPFEKTNYRIDFAALEMLVTFNEHIKQFITELVDRYLHKFNDENNDIVCNTLLFYKILVPIEPKNCRNCDCKTNEECVKNQTTCTSADGSEK